MEIVVGILVVIIALYFIASPLLDQEHVAADITLEMSTAQDNAKEGYIKALEDLEADLRMKKITEEDYSIATEEVKKEAGKLLD